MQLVSQQREERSGYGAQRKSPFGLGGTIAVHAVVIGAFLLMPKETFVRPEPGILDTYGVPPDPVPPPKKDPVKQKKDTPQTEKMQDPFIPESTVNTQGDGPTVTGTGEMPNQGTGTVEDARPIDPPKPTPVLVDPGTDPRYASLFQPDYPAAMIRQELEGKVTVRVQINAEGRVTAVEKLFATNDAFWQVTQAQALRKWRFRPATRDGVPVEGTRTMTVHFKLDQT